MDNKPTKPKTKKAPIIKKRGRSAKPETKEAPEKQAPVEDNSHITFNLTELKQKKASEIIEIAEQLEIDTAMHNKIDDTIFAILKKHAANGESIYSSGVMEIMQDGCFAFARSPFLNYNPSVADTYISSNLIRKYGLRTGDTVEGKIRPPKDNERYFALKTLEKVNGQAPELARKRVHFSDLTPLFANEQIILETGNGTTEDITARIIDLVSPVGRGQRGLIVSPPKAGKTIIMQNVAQAIARNSPEIELFVLLIDERPEEVTEMQRNVKGTVIASTFDEHASKQVQVAEMVLEQAKREVEQGKDVVILLDSITRLARAYNTNTPASGKILSGGVDANALKGPKKFFGAARNVEGGGSLTILATALVDTGSKMDEVIYEEFKGTGNMELHLNRELAEKRTFPAINIKRSGTRKEDLLVEPDILQKTWIIRKILHPMDDVSAAEFLLDRIAKTKTNQAFFDTMTKQ